MIEEHPFEPWLPSHAKLLMLGTFPPAEKRWCMPWYYPNFQNDMWRIFGIIYFGDKLHFVDQEHKTYRLPQIKEFLLEKGVAIYDTAQKVIRTKNTASDKDLQVVEPSDLDGMLRQLGECKAVLTAGHQGVLRAFWYQAGTADGRICGVCVRGAHTSPLSNAKQLSCLSYGGGEEG